MMIVGWGCLELASGRLSPTVREELGPRTPACHTEVRAGERVFTLATCCFRVWNLRRGDMTSRLAAEGFGKASLSGLSIIGEPVWVPEGFILSFKMKAVKYKGRATLYRM